MNKRNLIAGLLVIMVLTAFITKDVLKGVDIASMDKSANPREDFYQFANGSWCKNNPVPSVEARWTSFNILNEKNNENLKKILQDAAADKNAAPNSPRQIVGDFYRIAMDTNRIEGEGISHVLKELHNIDKIKDKHELLNVIAKFQKKGISCGFSFDVTQDIKKSDTYICFLSQGGLGLPDRDYYFKQDDKSNRIREEYKQYIMKMFQAVDVENSNAPFNVDAIMYIETELASASMTRVERRDMEKQYNKKAISEWNAMYPRLSFREYFDQIQIPMREDQEIIIAQPQYFDKLNMLFDIVALEQWKAYFKWKLINTSANYLNNDINKMSFDFYGTVLNGTKEQKPRWKRVISSANSLIGELVGQEYVKVAFSASSKKRINEMVDNLRESFRARIIKLDWMSETTKQKALEKLSSFSRKLGYPDKWKDYNGLIIKRDMNYLDLYFTCCEFEFRRNVEKLDKPVDRTEWEMLPQTVNAYYNPVNNEIVFPAAIMQPPFFNPDADDAVNYGAIGAVIGHEFSHGFDDQGSKYDAKGNMNKWWTDDDRKKFDDKTKVLVDQYNKFFVEDKINVNGELTLGENIADFAGLTVSYDAYQLSLKGKSKKNIDGYTPEQRFFIGYAQVWKNNARPEYTRQQVMTDPHSPGRFRVIGPLSNMPQFYAAFGVKNGDKMFRDEKDRASIW